MTNTTTPSPVQGRLYSLDFFRGLTMFLLVAEFTGFFNQLTDPSIEGTWLYYIGQQFHHHPWNGLRFWDLVQPYFMFIVGVALPYSIGNRRKRGQTDVQIRNHVLQRALLLLLLGWGLYCIGPGKIVFRFQNVLAQLSVTYLLAYLVMNRSPRTQIGFSLMLLLITEVLYRTFAIDGFDRPFTALENFGTWFDQQYGGADMHGAWVSFNAIPTTAHTIWGVLAGQLLRSERPEAQKLRILLIAGIVGVVAGYALNPISPIIKRICTSSFILASGGWTLLTLALSYWLIDMKGWRKGVLFFAIVGMNPLFIYLFSHIGGAGMLRRTVQPFTNSLLGWMGELPMQAITSLVTLYLLWYLCYWLYKRKIFIRL